MSSTLITEQKSFILSRPRQDNLIYDKILIRACANSLKNKVGYNNQIKRFLNKFNPFRYEMQSTVYLTENEALIVLCFFFYKKEYESQNELSRDWATLTQLNPNTYFHHAKRPIHELQWIEEIKEARSNRLLLNESYIDDIYYSKVKVTNDKMVNFFTYAFLKVRFIIPKLTIEEKKILIEESFGYIAEIEVMSNILALEEKIKKNVLKESFFVHYFLIKNSINELFYVFLSLEEFTNIELKKIVEKMKKEKIEHFLKEFLKNRIRKSELVIKSNEESRNLLFMNIKNLISEYESSETGLNEKLVDIVRVTKEIFNDGKKIIENFQERNNFITLLYSTVHECLTEGISV